MNQSKPQRAPIAWFDARSVMLFAALAVGGANVQAQNAPTASSTRSATSSSSPSSSPATNAGASRQLIELQKKRVMNRGSAAKAQRKTP